MRITFQILFVICIGQFMFGQSYPDYKVIYKLEYKLNPNLDAYNVEYFDLITSKRGSTFKSQSKSYRDSIMSTDLSDREKSLKIKEVNPGNFKSSIIITNDSLVYLDQLVNKSYRIDEEIPDQFVFEKFSKEINGFKCNLATISYAGRNWYVWYTMDLALPSGPYKFSGLPGLVIKAYDAEEHYVFTIYDLKKYPKSDFSDKVKSELMQSYSFQKISLPEFIKVRKEAMSSWNSFLNVSGVTIANSDKMEDREVSKKMKERLNFIEIN